MTSSSRSNANSDRACSTTTTLSIAASPSSPVLAHRRSQLVAQAGGYVAPSCRGPIHNFRSYLGPTRLALKSTSMPPPEPRSKTVSPWCSSATAVGLPQPRLASTALSGSWSRSSIAITMDTYSHVLPGLDAEAAGTVARLILGDGDQEPARPVDKALTTDRPTPSGREEVKREAPGQRGVRAGGFEP